MQSNVEESPSLHVASLPSRGAVVFCFDRQIVLCKLRLGEKQCLGSNGGHADPSERSGDVVVEELAIWTDSQRIRCVALTYLEVAKKLFVVTGGDGKMVHCFDASEGHRGECLLACGPHQKKVVALAIARSTMDIVFANKFGDVFLLPLTWDAKTATLVAQHHVAAVVSDGNKAADMDDEEDVSGDEGSARTAPQLAIAPRVAEGRSAATFLLQHFCLVTHVLLTVQPPRRLLSMDREGRVRVSRFPNTYDIQQFLWNLAPQSPVTAALELPLEDHCAATVVVLGDRAGRIAIWIQARGRQASAEQQQQPPSSCQQEFRRAFVLPLGALWERCCSDDGGATDGGLADRAAQCSATPSATTAGTAASSPFGIVALSYVSSTIADVHGILVAADGARELLFIPLRIGAFGVDVVGPQNHNRNIVHDRTVMATTAAGAILDAVVQLVPLPKSGQRPLGLIPVSTSAVIAVVAPGSAKVGSKQDPTGCELVLAELGEAGTTRCHADSSPATASGPMEGSNNTGVAVAAAAGGSSPYVHVSTISPLSPLVSALRGDGFASLPFIDVFAHWRPAAAKDPRLREGVTAAAAPGDDDRSGQQEGAPLKRTRSNEDSR